MSYDRHDPRRADALGLVRRQVSAGTFTKGDVARWEEELGKELVDGIVGELAPQKKKAASAGPKPDAPDKE